MAIFLLLVFSMSVFAQQSGYVPLTSLEKAKRAGNNLIRPAALIPLALGIGIAHGRDHPEEWGQDWAGLGQRTGHAFARLGVRNSFNLIGHMALGTDPRYDRCQCTGFGPRSKHAIRRTFMVRTDSGGERFHYGNFLSAYATNVITNQWRPQRYHTQSEYLQGTAVSIGINVGWNVLREFVFRRDD